jgi:hypothetical protein
MKVERMSEAITILKTSLKGDGKPGQVIRSVVFLHLMTKLNLPARCTWNNKTGLEQFQKLGFMDVYFVKIVQNASC